MYYIEISTRTIWQTTDKDTPCQMSYLNCVNWIVEKLECDTFDVSWTLMRKVITQKILNDVMLIWLSHLPGAGCASADAGSRPRSTWSLKFASSQQLLCSIEEVANNSVTIFLVHNYQAVSDFACQYQVKDSLINLFDLDVLWKMLLLRHNVRTSLKFRPGAAYDPDDARWCVGEEYLRIDWIVNPLHYVWGVSPAVLSSF